jgi:hypothetical protein
MTSESTSVLNTTPSCSSLPLREAEFSMIPLWTTAIFPLPSVCGWAFMSLTSPWSPSGVSYAAGPRKVLGHDILEVLDLSLPLEDRKPAVRVERDSGRVIAPVLETLQTLDEKGFGRSHAAVSDYSAHNFP